MFGWTLVALLCLMVVASLWIGVRGALAYQHLARIQTSVSEGAGFFLADPSAVSTLDRLAADAAASHELTSDPVWKIAESAPWVGPQLKAVATVAASSDELLGGSLSPFVSATQGASIDALKPVNGHIDVAALSTLASPAQTASVRARHAADALHELDRAPLIGIVGASVDEVSDLTSQAAATLEGLARTTQLLPGMLGDSGPRTYLLLVQNNAEWRSLGGITGTAILIRTDAGSVALGDAQSATALSSSIIEPVVTLPPDLTSIYATRPARYFHNLTQIPDFSVDGPLAQAMYERATGTKVDGVIAIDPVALSYLLQTTGPVALPEGIALSADNAAPFLLNTVYLDHPDPAVQDALFAQAAGAVFQALLEGKGSTLGLTSALSRATAEHRLLLWSSHSDEQTAVDGTPVAGELPVSDARTARFGVYLNDGVGSKMSYYVTPDVTLSQAPCAPAESQLRREVTLSLTLTNGAPTDAGSTLPEYITGGEGYGKTPGNAKTVVNMYLPEGAELVSATTSDGSPYESHGYQERQVLTFGSDLAPGSSTSILVTIRIDSSVSDVEGLVTPTANAALKPVVAATCK